jgi:sialic acid synthase SpsE
MINSYLYAETAFIHQGDISYLIELIHKVAKSKAQGIKFQVLTNADDFVSNYHTSYNELASYCFSLNEWQEIFSITNQLGLDIILMPLNKEALRLAYELPIRFIETHPVSFFDMSLKEAVKTTARNVIISTGGRTQAEIDNELAFYGTQVKILLIGFQSFPSSLEDIRLHQVAKFCQKYPELLIGYADHSSYDHEFATKSLEYAYLLGARVFEKHTALVAGEERVDYSAAVDCNTIDKIVDNLEFLAKYIVPTSAVNTHISNKELEYRNRQLVCVAAENLEDGHQLTMKDIYLKMYHDPSDTITDPTRIVGMKIKKAMSADEPFHNIHLTTI